MLTWFAPLLAAAALAGGTGATATISGGSSSATAGQVLATGGARAPVAGTSSTATPGSVVATGAANAPVAGSASAATVGQAPATGGSVAPITGSTSACAVGAVAATGGGGQPSWPVMPAVRVVFQLMQDAGPVTAMISDRTHLLRRPQQAAAYPCAVLAPAGGQNHARVGAASLPRGHEDRVRVQLQDTDFPRLMQLSAAVLSAVAYKRGTVAGVPVAQIERASGQADGYANDAGVYTRTLEFTVTYEEAA